MNKKEVKQLLKVLKKQFNFSGNLSYLFFKRKEKVYILSKGEVDFSSIMGLGMYFCKVEVNGIRLSIEGSQLIGEKCSENVYCLNSLEFKKWMTGEDVEVSSDLGKFVILKFGEDYLGCGIFSKGKILNFVPKNRRVKKENI